MRKINLLLIAVIMFTLLSANVFAVPDDPLKPLRIVDASIRGYAGHGIRVLYGYTDLSNVNVNITSANGYHNALSVFNNASSYTATNVTCNFCILSTSMSGNAKSLYSLTNGIVKVDNSVLNGNIHLRETYSTSFSIGSSKFNGVLIKDAGSTAKMVNCYDGNYDPITNGVY